MIVRPRTYLEQILQNIDRIASYAAEGSRAFFESTLLQDGIVHNLELIGSSVKKLPADLLDDYPHIPWSSMARIRDRLAASCMTSDRPRLRLANKEAPSWVRPVEGA